MGGRGSGSYSSMFGGQGGGSGANDTTIDLPARMNKLYNGNEMSQAHTLSTFKSEHLDSKTEHLIVYDDDGFVSDYRHGGASAVSIAGLNLQGKTTVHNHPEGGWSHFSAADLKTWASPNGEKRMVVTSKTADYTVTKTAKFNSSGFLSAIASAKTKEKNYDVAVDKWLTANAKKYGFTYSKN